MAIKKLYPCTEQQLYTTVDLAWANYQDNQSRFSGFKGKYTKQYGQDAIAEKNAARSIPTNDARRALTSTERIELVQLSDVALDNYKFLRSYIKDAFPNKKIRKLMLQAAGDNYFKQASHEGWEQLAKLTTMGMQFINKYTVELSNNSLNMPDAFPKKYEDGATKYEGFYNSFLKSKQTKKGGADAKVEANNAVYEKLTAMLSDGQLIFVKEPALHDEFVFSTLVSYITTAGTTGVHVSATDAITTMPVVGFTVTVLPINKTASADAKGVAEVEVAEAAYDIQIDHPDYEQVVKSGVKVTTGAMRQVKVALVKK